MLTYSDLLLQITELSWRELGTESNLLLGNTELALNKLDTLLNVSNLLGKLDMLMLDASLLLGISNTNGVELLVQNLMIVSIQITQIMFLGDWNPLGNSSINLLVLGTVLINSISGTSLLVEVLNLWNVGFSSTSLRVIILGTDEVISVLVTSIILSMTLTGFFPFVLGTQLVLGDLVADLSVTMTQTNCLWLAVLVALENLLVFLTLSLTNSLPVTTLLLGTNPFIIRTFALNGLVVCTLVMTVFLLSSIGINWLSTS